MFTPLFFFYCWTEWPTRFNAFHNLAWSCCAFSSELKDHHFSLLQRSSILTGAKCSLGWVDDSLAACLHFLTTQTNTVAIYLSYFLVEHMELFCKDLKRVLKLLVLLESCWFCSGLQQLTKGGRQRPEQKRKKKDREVTERWKSCEATHSVNCFLLQLAGRYNQSSAAHFCVYGVCVFF